MTSIIISVKCGRCSGTGIDNNTIDNEGNHISITCKACNGTGYENSSEFKYS